VGGWVWRVGGWVETTAPTHHSDRVPLCSDLQISQDRLDGCQETHRVLDAMEQRDLGPALAWVESHGLALTAMGSRLPFLIHRLAFISLSLAGDRAAAVGYAKAYLGAYASTEFSEIRRLLGSLAFVDCLSVSP
jgi:hypothetical protein